MAGRVGFAEAALAGGLDVAFIEALAGAATDGGSVEVEDTA